MAETQLHGNTVQEKLNKMAVDLIDVTLTTDAEAIGNNEVIAQSIEIENAVSVKGGAGILQSVMILDEDDEAPAVDLLFSQVNTSITDDQGEAIGNNIGNLNSTFRSFLGFVNVSNYTDLIDGQLAIKSNIGLVIKAASDTKSIWVHCINRSGGNYTPASTPDMKLRFGIVKD